MIKGGNVKFIFNCIFVFSLFFLFYENSALAVTAYPENPGSEGENRTQTEAIVASQGRHCHCYENEEGLFASTNPSATGSSSSPQARPRQRDGQQN